MTEHPPQPEFSSEEQELIEKIRGKSIEDPVVHEALVAWFTKLDDEVSNSPEVKETQQQSSTLNIENDIKKGKILMEAGFLDEAWMCFRSAEWSASSNKFLPETLHEKATALVQYMIDEGYIPKDDPSE